MLYRKKLYAAAVLGLAVGSQYGGKGEEEMRTDMARTMEITTDNRREGDGRLGFEDFWRQPPNSLCSSTRK